MNDTVDGVGVYKVGGAYFLFQLCAKHAARGLEVTPNAGACLGKSSLCIVQCKRCACGLHLLFCGALVWRPYIGSAICLLRLLKTLISLHVFAAGCFECSVKLLCIGVEFAHLSGFLSAAKRVQRPVSYIMQLSPHVWCAGRGQRLPVCAVPRLHPSA